MHLMGWPSIPDTTITDRDLRGFSGEGIHLGCLAIVVNSIFLDPLAPWWVGASSSEGPAAQPAIQIPPASVDGPAQKKPRRIRQVKSLT